MQRFWNYGLGMVLASTLAGMTLAQERKERDAQPPQQDPPEKTTTITGTIVRVQPTGQFVVKTTNNKEVTLYGSPKTRYLINNKTGKYSDLRVGTSISAGYTIQDDRHIVNSVTVGGIVQSDVKEGTPRIAEEPGAPQGTRIRGKIARMQGEDRVVIRQGNKDVILYVNPQTRYRLNNKAVRFTDLRVGADINAYYTLEQDRYLVSSILVGDDEPNETTVKDTTVQGTVIRIVGKDQVVVKTGDNKEVIVYVNPQTTYTFEEKAGRFTDVRPGADIRIDYNVRDQRNFARRILGLPRRDR